MTENIFLTDNLADNRPMELLEHLKADPARGNLGSELPVMVYRMLEYSLKDELTRRYGKAEQIDIFRAAGRAAGKYFAEHFLDLDQPMDRFVSELQNRLQEMKIGVMRIERVEEATGQIVLTVAEDADCSGLPVLGETVCNYDEGFIAGILSTFSHKHYTATEIDCWATGDRVCRFRAEVQQE